ncbi:MAG TPA: PaaI family thioesterase [Bacteroidales bacterium]|nr:PaaI family thioesterase [Bacteroidales bacterium]
MINKLNEICRGTFISFLGIEFLNYGDDFLEASMPVDNKLQPMGLLHGGASLALAETIASGGSYLHVDASKYDVVGLQVSGNHLSPVSEGMLYARADIIHRGRKTHVWDVRIKSDTGKLISVVRVTMMIIKKKQHPDAGSIEQ